MARYNSIKDDLEDEAETRARYPFLYDDEDYESAADDSIKFEDGSVEISCCESEEVDTDRRSENLGPNYHYLDDLDEELLPNLDYYRWDNFFGGRPAHNYFNDDSKSDVKITRLFGDYLLEGELAILFADSGVGKSILATQIAQSIASGFPIEPFGLDTPPQRVAFFDLELSQEQFDRRYSNEDPLQPAKFPFHRNFIRNPPYKNIEIPDWAKNEVHFINESIQTFVEFSKARVVIIDNLSYLNTNSRMGNSNPRLVKFFSNLAKEMNITILFLTHTPKRNFRAPLTIYDLRNSKGISNYAGSIFALGTSRLGPDIRYIKSIKRRNTAWEDSNKVATLRIEKDVCFLGMKFEGWSDERDHIGWMSSAKESERVTLIEKVTELNKLDMTQREIGRKLGVSASTVNRCLREAAE